MIIRRAFCLFAISVTCIACGNNFKSSVQERAKEKDLGDDLLNAIKSKDKAAIDKLFASDIVQSKDAFYKYLNGKQENIIELRQVIIIKLHEALKLASLEGDFYTVKKIKDMGQRLALIYPQDPVYNSKFVFKLCSKGLWKIFTLLFDEEHLNLLSRGILQEDIVDFLLRKRLVELSCSKISYISHNIIINQLLAFNRWFDALIEQWSDEQIFECLGKTLAAKMYHLYHRLHAEMVSRWVCRHNFNTSFRNDCKVYNLEDPMIFDYFCDYGLYPTFS